MTALATERLLQVAGLLLWAMVGLPAAVQAIAQGVVWDASLLGWTACYLAWGAAFARVTRPGHSDPPGVCLALLGVQSATAIALARWGHGGAEPALLAAVAGQTSFLLAPRAAFAWVAAQSAALGLVFAMDQPPLRAFVNTSAFVAFQLFAMGVGLLADSERRARLQLALAHAELQGAREILAHGSRGAERLRISRELHDSLGHHLTALSLQLEVAGHVAEGPALEHVQRAHAVTRLLLADLRGVVGDLREDAPLDLRAAVSALAASVPEPRVHLELPEPLAVDDAEVAHAVLRCVQELITNAVRHARARNLWIAIERAADGLTVRARDDGRGATTVRVGHGLVGMRERVQGAGGRLDVETSAGHGFAVTAFWPLPAR